jgi:hypothetical protein
MFKIGMGERGRLPLQDHQRAPQRYFRTMIDVGIHSAAFVNTWDDAYPSHPSIAVTASGMLSRCLKVLTM